MASLKFCPQSLEYSKYQLHNKPDLSFLEKFVKRCLNLQALRLLFGLL
ncbi:hypothetical protein [Wolbachia endosymbiont (group A) of Anoplius nigerrimus]|nr:hypothetical protein [Wolbachia endosymbiont (group A) of Anoplius nigerrimus]